MNGQICILGKMKNCTWFIVVVSILCLRINKCLVLVYVEDGTNKRLFNLYLDLDLVDWIFKLIDVCYWLDPVVGTY